MLPRACHGRARLGNRDLGLLGKGQARRRGIAVLLLCHRLLGAREQTRQREQSFPPHPACNSCPVRRAITIVIVIVIVIAIAIAIPARRRCYR